MGRSEELINAVLERAKKSGDGKRLPCAEAFKLAQKFGAEVIEIGRICNRSNVKICKCQLGCFK